MPRITMVEVPDEALHATSDGDRVNLSVGRVMMHRPAVAASLGAVSDALRSEGTLPRRLVELVRLRIAFHNQCRSCMAIRYSDAVDDGLTEDLVCSLERPADGPGLTAAERAALRFADLLSTNHLVIDDVVYASLRDHFDEGQIVELGIQCAMFVGIGRLVATWRVVEDLPEPFSGTAPTAPWAHAGLPAT